MAAFFIICLLWPISRACSNVAARPTSLPTSPRVRLRQRPDIQFYSLQQQLVRLLCIHHRGSIRYSHHRWCLLHLLFLCSIIGLLDLVVSLPVTLHNKILVPVNRRRQPRSHTAEVRFTQIF